MRRTSPSAFTLVEALVSLMLATLASSALYLSLYAALQTTTGSFEQSIASGIAEQLVDEALGALYVGSGESPYTTTLGPTTFEAQGSGRSRFNDTDDYNAFAAQPPQDPSGIVLGWDDGAGGQRHPNFVPPSGYFDAWREEVSVYYVSETDPTVALTGTATSNLRAIEVVIYKLDSSSNKRELARLRRVFSYVPGA